MDAAPFLSIDRISKRFGTRAALDEVSLEVSQGEFLTLLGPSGSGKSTLLAVLAGFAAPDRGRVHLRGVDITGARPEHRRFGVLPQGHGLFPHLSVFDNVAFPLSVRRVAPARLASRVAEVLALVRIGELQHRMPHELSGGQQQRVALARALSFEPELLLLDEPMSALDAQLRRDLGAELKRLHRHVGTTFVHVTHDQQESLALSDRVAVLHQGRLEQVGLPRTLYAKPASRFVAGFLGRNNLLAVRAQGHDDHGARFDWGGRLVRAPAALAQATGDCVLSVRPEDIRIGRVGTEAPASSAPWRGRVTAQTFHGAASDLTVRVGEHTLVVSTPDHDASPVEGDEVWLAPVAERIWRLPVEATA